MAEKGVEGRGITELRLRTRVFFGVGALHRIAFILQVWRERGISSVLVVSGASAYRTTGAWSVVAEALRRNGMTCGVCDRITPNPATSQVDDAVAVGRSIGAQAVLGIGGGSAIDVAKAAAIMLACGDESALRLFELQYVPRTALPIAVVNLTHGTGSEGNRFSVVSISGKEYKPAIAYDCIYPEFAIDDPALTVSLSPEQTRCVTVDVLNHAVEAATAKTANPLAVTLAREAVRLVVRFLPQVLRDPHNLEGRYFLLYASLLAGCAFDNGLLHLTHALEHPLSGMKPKLAHGLGLAMLLPSVVREIYPAKGAILADLLHPIDHGLSSKGADGERAALALSCFLEANGMAKTLKDCGFSESDVPHLTNLVFETPSLDTLLAAAPVAVDRGTVMRIYRGSL